MMNAYGWLISYLELTGSKRIGKKWQCPSHPDSYPSLSINPGSDGRALVTCFAGCTYEQILKALCLPPSALTSPLVNSPNKQLVAVSPRIDYPRFKYKPGGNTRNRGLPIETRYHEYTNTVRLAREVYERGKQIRWEIKDRNGSWRYSRDGEIERRSLPLYNLSEVHFARAVEAELILCESESSVDALSRAGLHATTWAGGAGSVPIKTLLNELSGMKILWVPDNDPAGLKCSEYLSAHLAPHCASWRELIGEPGQDARDILEIKGAGAFNK